MISLKNIFKSLLSLILGVGFLFAFNPSSEGCIVESWCSSQSNSDCQESGDCWSGIEQECVYEENSPNCVTVIC